MSTFTCTTLATAPRGRADRGTALLVAVISILIMAGVAFSYLGLAHELNQETEVRRSRIAALFVAEAGARIVLEEMADQAEAAESDPAAWTIYDGQVFAGDLGWGKYSVTVNDDGTSDNWILTSTGRVSNTVGSAVGGYTAGIEEGTTQRTIQLIAVPELGQPPGPFGWSMFSHNEDFVSTDPIFSDSFDSTVAGYAPSAPAAPFTTDFDGNGGDIGTNGDVALSSTLNEVHGLVQYGNGAAAGFAGTTLSSTGETAPVEADAGVVNDAVDATTISDAQATNSNGDINTDAVQDPLWYTPGVWEPYDSFLQTLFVAGSTTVKLGNQGGTTPNVYYFSGIDVMFGGTIEFVGPAVVVLNGAVTADAFDGVSSMVLGAGVNADDVLVYGGPGAQVFQMDSGSGLASADFGCGFYGPSDTIIQFVTDVNINGSYIASGFQTYGGAVKVHYDNALSTVGGGSTAPIIGYNGSAWIEK